MPPKRSYQPDNALGEDTSAFKSTRESKKCNECRRRHVKCDEQRPKCSNCVKNNADCSYSHRTLRYDHISDRQRRDDVYTEIDDISKRVESLLDGVQKTSVDDVTRLAMDYGWQVTVAPDGQKRIMTDIGTMSQLAALVPKALTDVYGRSTQIFTTATSSSASCTSSSSTVVQETTRPPGIYKPLSHYFNVPIDMTTAPATCPSLLTMVLSPALLGRLAGGNKHQRGTTELAASLCMDANLFACLHQPEGYFATPVPLVPSTHLDDDSFLQQQTRFADCSLLNLFWNLIKSMRLCDKLQFSQAYVNLGVIISKMFSLQLHLPNMSCPSSAPPLERELHKRLFWAVWLLDTQVPLLYGGRPSIDAALVHPDRPALCEGMSAQEDIEQTEFLQQLIQVRWLRRQIEQSFLEKTGPAGESDLNKLIQHMRQLRRFYEHLDEKLKLEIILAKTPAVRWSWTDRTGFVVLVELCLNWLVLMDPFLPPSQSTPGFPGNLAITLCRQAADIILLILEKWIWQAYDCQTRFLVTHVATVISMQKYLCRCTGVTLVQRWKAYASLQFLHRLLDQKTDPNPLGGYMVQNLAATLHDLRDIAQGVWNPLDEPDSIEIFAKYFSDYWQPSFDQLPTEESTYLFARESSTMFAVIEMRKQATSTV